MEFIFKLVVLVGILWGTFKIYQLSCNIIAEVVSRLIFPLQVIMTRKGFNIFAMLLGAFVLCKIMGW